MIPTKLEILQYAWDGLIMEIGIHPDPNNDEEYMEMLEQHLAYVEKRIAELTKEAP